jgi:hypothetical protein
MRPSFMLALIIMIPPAYLGVTDYMKYSNNPTTGFKFSDIGQVWIDHDPAGFEQYKAEYKTKPKEWDEEIRPYLEWNAFSTALAPALAYNLLLMICWLIGIGPFRDWTLNTGSSIGNNSGLSRSSANSKGSRISYRRK